MGFYSGTRDRRLRANFFPLDLELSGNEPGEKVVGEEDLLEREIGRGGSLMETDTFLTSWCAHLDLEGM